MIHSASYTTVSAQFNTGSFIAISAPSIANGNFSISANTPKNRLQLTHVYEMATKSSNRVSLTVDVPVSMSLEEQTQMGLLWDRLSHDGPTQDFHKNAIDNNYILSSISARYYSSY